MAFSPPKYLLQYNAPDYSSSSSSQESYDYSGLDEHLQRQEQLAGMRDSKYASLYAGDVARSVSSGNKVRDLLKALRAHSPYATERDPIQRVKPLVLVSSRSNSSSNSGGGGGWRGANDDFSYDD